MKTIALPVAMLLAAIMVTGPARPEEAAATPTVGEMPLVEYAEIRGQANVLTVELRADTASAAAPLPLAQRPEAFAQDDIGTDCLAVLVIDDSSATEDVTTAAARFGAAGCDLRRLSGTAADWIAADLAGSTAPRPPVRPGDVPFVIPRGLCEGGEPVQVFD